MAASLGHSKMKRMETRKSHSWWWDSHISPKNDKWLAENFEEMDQRIKRMLKLVEADAESFGKRAEMYYQKRPELIALIEELYHMHRAPAERYDHVTGELRKNIPSDLQSQGSGISDISSELLFTCLSPDQMPGSWKSGPRAAPFDVLLGSGGSSTDLYQKDADELSSLSDSETQSDCSSINNYSGFVGNSGDQGLQRKFFELEIELCEAKEELRLLEERNADGSRKGVKNESFEDLLARTAVYEQELKLANENIRLSNGEITRLKNELQKYKLSEMNIDMQEGELNSDQALKLQEGYIRLEAHAFDLDSKVQILMEELRITIERLQFSEEEVSCLKTELETYRSEKIHALQNQLQLAKKDIVTWKSQVNSERKEFSKLQERITRSINSFSDRDHEIRNLKTAVSDAEQKIFPEKAQIKAEISGLLDEKTCLEEHLREWESRGRSLEEEIRKIKTEKTGLEERLYGEIEQLKADIAEKNDHIENLNGSLNTLRSERGLVRLDLEVYAVKEDVTSRDDQIDEMKMHLEQLHMKHMKLIASAEETGTLARELRSRAKEMEEEIEKQRVMILELAKEKREAIRQLCFTLEHYRNGYVLA